MEAVSAVMAHPASLGGCGREPWPATRRELYSVTGRSAIGARRTISPSHTGSFRARRAAWAQGGLGATPQFQGRAGNKGTCLIRPTPPEKTSARQAVWGRSPSFRGGWAGNKGTSLIRPTPPEKASARQGVWGRSPQFQGRVGGNKDTYLVSTMTVQKTWQV